MRSEGLVVLCVCVQASHPLLTQLQDQVDIPMDSVSCSLQLIWRVSYNGLVSKIAIALPYSRAHGSRPILYAKRAHFPHSFRIQKGQKKHKKRKVRGNKNKNKKQNSNDNNNNNKTTTKKKKHKRKIIRQYCHPYTNALDFTRA